MNEGALRKQDAEINKEMKRITTIIFEILSKYPEGISDDELFQKVSKQDRDAAEMILSLLVTGGSVIKS
jgi:hypothetical protein